MNKYFIQLFLKENTVILPGFGALTAPNGNVEEIMFLPYLKTDDGKLADYIAETEGIDPQDAQNTIAKFIREMEVNLNKGESFDIFQFGSFSKNETGEIEFESWLKKKSDEKEAVITPIIDIEENVAPDEVEEPIGEMKEEAEPIIFIPEEISDKIEVEQNIEKVVEEKARTTENKDQGTVFTIPPPTEKKEEEKKKKLGIPFWIVTALVLGLIATGIYFFSQRNKSINPQTKTAQKENSKTPKAKTEKRIAENIEKDTTANEPIEEKIPEPSTSISVVQESTKGFFLINGVYSSESVASKKVEAAQKEGLDAKILPKGNGKMYISLADFTDRNQANEMLKTLRNKGYKVWVLQK